MNQIESKIETLLTAMEVKKILNCSLPLVYKMAARGQIPSIRWTSRYAESKNIRNVVRFKKQDIIEFIRLNYYKKGNET